MNPILGVEEMVKKQALYQQLHTPSLTGPRCGKKTRSTHGPRYGAPYEVNCLKCYYIARHGKPDGYKKWYAQFSKEQKIYEMNEWYDRLLRKSSSRGKYDRYLYDKAVEQEQEKELNGKEGIERFRQWAKNKSTR